MKFLRSMNLSTPNSKDRKSTRPREESSLRPRRVSFSSKPQVIQLPLHEQVPVEDVWYIWDESKQIRKQNRNLIKLMQCRFFRKKLARQQVEDDIRGLERGLGAIAREQRHYQRLEALAVVLSHQKLRSVEGQEVDHEKVASAYHVICRDATDFAREMALEDERYHVVQHVCSLAA